MDPILQAWIGEYDAIREEYIDAVGAMGVRFGRAYAWRERTESLLEKLAASGATLRNGCASVVSGPISEACVACTGGAGSRTFYYSLKCNRSCYFCFNPNQEDYEHYLEHDYDWRADFAELDAMSGMYLRELDLSLVD